MAIKVKEMAKVAMAIKEVIIVIKRIKDINLGARLIYIN
jgi:hypothetical protein